MKDKNRELKSLAHIDQQRTLALVNSGKRMRDMTPDERVAYLGEMARRQRERNEAFCKEHPELCE